ncbi:phosphatase 2C-like domain-containing protein [Mycena latifolia]|nr:phosphatase 2C-like domain-containing protein [Mycena latifolia]
MKCFCTECLESTQPECLKKHSQLILLFGVPFSRNKCLRTSCHCGSQLSDFAAQTLPALLSERLRGDDVDVEAVMKDTIEEFDRSLLVPVLASFDEGKDFSDAAWLDTEKAIYSRIGYSSKDERYQAGLRATVGSTALVAFLDQQKTHLWVASLGDCDAVCGRRTEDDKWTSLFLSERHNCKNPAEVQRLHQEHPNEAHVIQDDTLLSTLCVTRALGDHQLKAPFFTATRLLAHFHPPRLEPEEILAWGPARWTPPYMLSMPAVRRHDVRLGDVFLFASDGLQEVLPARVPDAQKFNVVLSLAHGEHDVTLALALGHECIPAHEGDNVAQRVIENVLHGTDAKKRARELDTRTKRDDISLVVVTLQ